MQSTSTVKQAWVAALTDALTALKYTSVAKEEIIEWASEHGTVTDCPTLLDDPTCEEDIEPLNSLLFSFWDEPVGDSWAAGTSAFSSEGLPSLPDLGAWWAHQDADRGQYTDADAYVAGACG